MVEKGELLVFFSILLFWFCFDSFCSRTGSGLSLTDKRGNEGHRDTAGLPWFRLLFVSLKPGAI